MRRRMSGLYGLKEDKEMHASVFLGGDTTHCGLDVARRAQCAHHVLRTMRGMAQLRLLRHAVRKDNLAAGALLEMAWQGLGAEILRSTHGSMADCGSKGMVIVMDHHGDQPQRSLSMEGAFRDAGQPLLDHPFGRRSHESLFLQCADLLGYLTKQALEPNRHFQGGEGRRLIRRADALFGHRCPVSLPHQENGGAFAPPRGTSD